MSVRRVVALLSFLLLVNTTGARTPSTAAAAPRGGTLRVIMTRPEYFGLDPQSSYDPPEFELLRCCLVRTLMMFPGVPEFPGTQPVPDLATAPPTVSPDGMTWTFHLRTGLHYAPPLQDVEITSGDILRALLRAGSADLDEQHGLGGPEGLYLPLIDGFTAYKSGEADTISGVTTPDDHTLTIQEVRPDRTLEDVFAMAFTAPIPPSPSDPAAPLGVATGHRWGHPSDHGYGPFLVASGPYMFEGSAALDVSAPADKEEAVEGNRSWWSGGPGTITLVRDPSWDLATDPNRPALADRIEVSVTPDVDPYAALGSGAADMIMGDNPPPDVLERYASNNDLHDLVDATTAGTTAFGTINVAQPPFDDVHVRRALLMLLDPAKLARMYRMGDQGTGTSHLVPDAMDSSLMASWDPFGGGSSVDRIRAARSEMDASRYARSGRCVGSACEVKVDIRPRNDMVDAEIAGAEGYFRRALATLGISASFRVTDLSQRNPCDYPMQHFAICSFAEWGVDYPDAGNMFFLALSKNFRGSPTPTMLGTTPGQLRTWGYRTQRVPSIDGDYVRCGAERGVDASLCWARLDQLVVYDLAAVFPVFTPSVIRLRGPRVTAFSLDQAFGEPSLDRVGVAD